MINTAYDAWYSGFEAGVYFCVNGSDKLSTDEFKESVASGKLDSLIFLQNVGRDTENGIWSIVGSRMGVYMTMLTDWDHTSVNDQAHLAGIWATIENENPDFVAGRMSEELVEELSLPIVNLDVQSSKFFKRYAYLVK